MRLRLLARSGRQARSLPPAARPVSVGKAASAQSQGSGLDGGRRRRRRARSRSQPEPKATGPEEDFVTSVCLSV